MSVLIDLAKYYDENYHYRYEPKQFKDKEGNVTEYYLSPLLSTNNNSDIEITLDENSEFVAISFDNQKIYLPATQDSLTRGLGDYPHIIFDKMDYLEKDNEIYFKKKSKATSYFRQLKENIANPLISERTKYFLSIIYTYLKNNSITLDIVNSLNHLSLDENSKVVEKEKEKNSIPLLKLEDITKTFIIFSLYINDEKINLWEDKAFVEDCEKLSLASIKQEGLCHVTGVHTKLLTKHPIKIRHNGDSTKIISKPTDEGMFTYKGQFVKAEDAFSVSAELSLKAHAALSWLIRSGNVYKIEEKYHVMWTNDNRKIPNLFSMNVNSHKNNEDNQLFSLFAESATELEKPIEQITNEELSSIIQTYFNGLSEFELKHEEKVHYIVIDSVSYRGRMAVLDYQVLSPENYLSIFAKWYKKAFAIKYKYNSKEKTQVIDFYTPSFYTVSKKCFKDYEDKKLYLKILEKLQQAVMYNKKIPTTIISQLFNQIMLTNFKTDNDFYSFKDNLAVLEAVYRYNNPSVPLYLDTNYDEPDYLFGRAFAYYHKFYLLSLKNNSSASRKNVILNYLRAYQLNPLNTIEYLNKHTAFYDKENKEETTYVKNYLLKSYYSKIKNVEKTKIYNKIHKHNRKIFYDYVVNKEMKKTALSPLFLIGFMHELHKNKTSKDEISMLLNKK